MGEHKSKSKDSKKKSSKKDHKEHKREHRKHKRSSPKQDESQMDFDYSDPSLWEEKPEHENTITKVPDSLTSSEAAAVSHNDQQQEQQKEQEQSRHGWMLDSSFNFGDFGSSKAKPVENKPHPDELKVSHRELNVHLKSGKSVDEYPEEKKPTIKYGDAGSNWRMMKLKRVFEQAEDEKRSVEEVGLERYGSKEKLQEALDERKYLDQRKHKKGKYDDQSSRNEKEHRKSSHHHHHHHSSSRSKYVFTDTKDSTSSSSSRSQFKMPSTSSSSSKHSDRERRKRSLTPPPSPSRVQRSRHIESPSAQSPSLNNSNNQPATPLVPVLTRDELNKLNSKLVKAKIMGDESEVNALEEEYKRQLERYEAAENGTSQSNTEKSVSVLPTVDSEGKLYDYALSKGKVPEKGNIKGKQLYKGTHDKVTGERIRYSATDDSLSLMDMVRQERAGGRRGNNMDLEFANRIVTDASFENNLDYMDDKADVMAAKKGVSEEKMMRFAINDHKRTQQILDTCRYCYHDDTPPQLAMISLATQTYLALPNTQELTPGHCLIVPLQHVGSTLECDDDVWTEIRNFQKCLLRMFDEQNCGVVFMETVTNLRSKRHTVIEAIPIPYGVYEDAPAYFKEAIMEAGEEWSQHKKVIDTATDRGFRNSMVKNLPYFHVWCGLDKGYGHVIENEKDFPYWFGKEVIGGMLDISPEQWRKPKYHHKNENKKRQQAFMKNWSKWDWTLSLPS
ncbi:CwfJ C-terminus 1-domain-containing protein-like protein [Cunninghamella echinulata]|nr:CwfJ C-terminus 1-domain-containing protein-like protein [Cunninghamella echinulata]